MNYFLNKETLTQKEDSGKKTGKDRRKCKQKMGNVFCKKRSNGESRNSTQIKVWKENAKNSRNSRTRCQNDRSTEGIQ